ncbi:PKD domain-containing protein [Methanospirillum sp. J.3.6.1-F.2.7.3]|uniref:PKD domain-containing protein n=1 Tax=Methanospirillum purgamenti TaxID=2834276 RepID=A0A8E7EGR2_9EURY|nr:MULTISPECIES: PKD domain-containing protein [Methanospirillum]MDX8550441.1 PKD domain-containing protein [Methanospirillum hungatei]QVV88137.1 PKD domain-containing protein [Methanospirillum sp. J.3.6.1-F.2.7.3]
MEKLKLTRVIHWITFIIIASGIISISIADVTLTAPGELTRGGMGDAGLGMDGHFDITVGGNGPFALGFIVNPMNMTGDYCDRLPYFSNGAGYVSGVVENEPVNPPIDRGNLELGTSSAVFKELIPTPDNFISNGCWEIPWNGSRYLGYGTGGTYTLNTTYPPEYGIMGLKPGTYTIHAQTIDGAINEFDTTKFAESEVTIRYGDLDIQFLDYNEFKKGNNLNIDWAYLGGSPGRVVIKGLNTDSFKTYLWLTGPSLPECGTGLQNVVNLPVTTMVPEILTLPNNPWGDDQQPTALHKYIETSIGSGMYTGEWEYIWDISDIGLSPGNYTLYASSVDPSEALEEYCKGNISCKPDCSLNETCLNDGGVCSLLSCDKCCAPPVAIAEIELRAPPKAELSIIPDVELCCCEKYPCKTTNCGEISIPVSGKFFIPRMPLQIWVFGNNLLANKSGYLFTDNMTTMLTDDGYFEMDIYRDILQKQGICPCDLETGQYFVVIQTPYRYKNGKEIFDVTLEGSKAMNQITGPIVPRDQEQKLGLWKYVVESKPVYWTRSFAVEGDGAIGGYDAYSSLINILPKYNDPYYVLQFNITDRCYEYVDFFAEPVYGTNPLTVQFTDRSTVTGVSWLWDFGDGSTSTDRNPEHEYKGAGKYSVTLSVNTGSAIYSKTMWNYVSTENTLDDPSTQKLKADFGVNGPKVGKPPLTVQFVDKSTGNPVAWKWIFGDGQTSSFQSPQNTYPSEGSFSVYLEVLDKNLNSANITKVGYVKVDSSAIRAAFRYSFPDTNDFTKVQFNDISEGTGINKWSWNFGDGGSSNQTNPLYQYPAKGCYSVSLKVENDITSAIRSYQICI